MPKLLSYPATLRTGKKYRARLLLSGMAKTFGTAEMIKAKFAEQGFSDITVWMDNSHLPDDWPGDKSQQGGTRFIEGSWTSADQTGPKPDEVEALYEL